MKSNIVGPGTYVSHNEFSKNDAPAYSMGKRIKESKGTRNMYNAFQS